MKAQYQLAQMHIHGQGVPKDFAKAPSFIDYLLIKGIKSPIPAWYAIQKGHGVAQDYQEATRWLKKSLEEIK